MPRLISFVVLLAIVLLVSAVFFHVMAQFIVPLFLACVLVIVFHPLHAWTLKRVPRHPRLAALTTTSLILLAVLLPLTWLGWNAYLEAQHAISWLEGKQGQAFIDRGYKWVDKLIEKMPGHQLGEPNREPTTSDTTRTERPSGDASRRPLESPIAGASPRETPTAGQPQPPTETPHADRLLGKLLEYIGPFLLAGVQTVLSMILGLVVMVVSIYFFLADGPAMLRALMQLSPLSDQHELELLARFVEISRSVVVATLLSAVAQGVAAGIGYYFVLPSEAPVFLLTALTMVFAIVPFVGAAGIWVPVCLGLLLLGSGDGEPTASNWPTVLGFSVYCAVVVSGLDNVIKPYVLHGQSNLHPLLALLSILGGVKVLGPIGILVGPMLVSFLQALLSIFQREVERWENPTKAKPDKLSPAAEAIAESIEAAVEAAEGKAEEKPPAKAAAAKTAKSPRGRRKSRRR